MEALEMQGINIDLVQEGTYNKLAAAALEVTYLKKVFRKLKAGITNGDVIAVWQSLHVDDRDEKIAVLKKELWRKRD